MNIETEKGLTPKQREFLGKLSRLFVEYGAEMSSCGCCGSPAIDIDGKELQYVRVLPDGQVEIQEGR